MALNHPNEDLFEETRMSFGEHLEELRAVLVRALIGVGVGFAIGLWQASNVVGFIQTPLKEAIQQYNKTRAEKQIKAVNDGIIPLELLPRLEEEELIPKTVKVEPRQLFELIRAYLPEEVIDVTYVPFQYTPEEIVGSRLSGMCQQIERASRDPDDAEKHLIWSLLSDDDAQTVTRIATGSEIDADDQVAMMGVLNRLIEDPKLHRSKAFAKRVEANEVYKAYSEEIADAFDEDQSRRLNRLLVSELFSGELNAPSIPLSDMQVWESARVTTQALNPQESFMIWLKAGFITGLLISSPWLFYQLWLFVAAGLYPHEKQYVHIYLPFSVILFLGGAALAFFFVFKPVLEFLFSFNDAMGIDPEPRIGEWLSFVMFMPIGFGLAFQLPLVMLFLNRIGLLSVEAYIEKWRIAVLVIAVMSMVFTPADPISMLMLAIPLTVLYFGGIGLCKWMPRGRNPFTEAYDPA